MIVKVGNEYLELEELIEVEKKVKLFEDISAVEGDFSFSFSIPKTQNNIGIIQIYSVNDILKKWNFKVPAEILSEAGISIYSGFIRIQGDNSIEYSASFFSGNTNWIDELDVNLVDIDWSDFDPVGQYHFTETEGVVTPLTDRGGLLINRKSAMFSDNDLQPYIYAKDIVKRVLTINGMKITGDIHLAPEYQALITSAGSNKYLQKEIEKREVFVAKSGTQVVPFGVYQTITLTNTAPPFYNSPNGNWNTSTSTYTFDINTKAVEIELDIILDTETFVAINILKNGSDSIYSKIYSNVTKIQDTITPSELLDTPDATDYYEVQIGRFGFSPSSNMVSGSSVKIRAVQFWKIFANTIVPDMTAATFISNILRMMNLLVTYNATTKTLKTIFLDNVLRSNPIDLSGVLVIDSNNYDEFISDYAKQNLMIWGEQDNDQTEEYNEANLLPYASGTININNDFLEDQDTMIEMDFVAPFQQMYGFLGMELPMTDYIKVSPKITRDLDSVSEDTSLGYGIAVFHYSGSSVPPRSLIRISDSTIEEYNGDYYAVNTGSSQFFAYTPYLGDATGRIQVLEYELQGSDPVFLLNNPNLEIGDISSVTEYFVSNLTTRTTIAVANFLPTDNFNLSLSFADLKIRYFNSIEKMLNTGVKSYSSGYLTEKQYNDIDFTRTIKVEDSVYFVNVERGYKGSKYPVELELIKIR